MVGWLIVIGSAPSDSVLVQYNTTERNTMSGTLHVSQL